MNTLHITEVEKIITMHPEGIPRFERWLAERFGSDAKFANCSGLNLEVKEVLPFLLSKERVYTESGVTFSASIEMAL